MTRIGRSSVVSAILCTAIPIGSIAQVAAIEDGAEGLCYDIDTYPDIYSDAQVIKNLRLLGLEPVTAHSATPSATGDDTGPIQEAIFTAMEDCVNAYGLEADGTRDDPQGVPTGADPDIYIDSCRAVFFPPGEYRVSDTIRVMQPLKPKSGNLDLSLNGSGQVLYDTDAAGISPTTTPALDVELAMSGGGNGVALRRKSNVLIGSTCQWGNRRRPVIRANPGTFVTQKPIFQFWAQCRDGGDDCSPDSEEMELPAGTTDPAYGQSTVLFNNIFRNIDIDSNVGPTAGGERNTGAIGISFPGAQGSAIEDSTITLTDGNGNHSYMGIRNIPGQSGGIYNVTVKGGQYGLWMDLETRFGMAVGLRLYGQESRAILHTANNKFVVVGFHITRQESGNAIRVNTDDPNPSYGKWSGIAMVDGYIENGGNAVMNVQNRSVYLKNVLIGGTGTNMVTTGTDSKLTKNSAYTWAQVNEWAYVSNTADSGVPYGMINENLHSDGTDGVEEVEVVVAAADPGTDNAIEGEYITPHLWSIDDLPSFEDDESIVLLAKRFNTNSVTYGTGGDKLSDYLANDDRVFLGGSGRHPINATVTLAPGQALAGLDRVHTVIETRWLSLRSTAAWCDDVPMISTTNSASNDARFGRVSLAEYKDCTTFTPVDWKAGADSSMHAVMLTRSDSDVDLEFKNDPNQAGFRFSGNGGGRHWGLQPEGALIEYQTDNSGYRHLSIEGTDKQLDIYGFNCEKVSGGTYACELDAASNVNLYNVKAETCKQCNPGGADRDTSNSILRLNMAQDVNVIGYGGNARPSDGQRALIVIEHASTDNLVLALINPNTSEEDPEDTTSASNWFTVRRNISPAEEILGPHIGAYVRQYIVP